MPNGSPTERPLEEIIERTEGLQPWRRVFHMTGGSLVAWVVYALAPDSPIARWLLVGLSALVFLIDVLRLRHESLNRIYFGVFSAFASPREADRMSGFPGFLFGAFLTLLVAGGAFAIPSILVLSFCDPAAGTVGSLWGRHSLGKGSVEGTLAFLVMAVAILIPFAGVWTALAVAAIVAALEAFPSGLNDNLVIPVAASLSLWALS